MAGPVRVLVSDDGSSDDTAQIAWAEFARFRHARGAVLSAPNGGQAAALNRGLAVTDAEIVVRIDADCVMGPDALAFSVPWFRDPRIGSVGAMEEPRTDDVTWFHRLRALETLFQFRFARLGQSLVDGIVVIPGTFTAFRRDPVILAGGFPVRMNGEDSDVTMQIGRLGYRVVIDPRIRSFEDVPRTIGEFVEQRTRWTRASFHVYARHVPLRSGFAGPRVWFWTVRRGFSWFSLPAGLWPRSSCSNSCSPIPATGRTSPRSSCCMPLAARFRWPSACRSPSSTGTGAACCGCRPGSPTRSCGGWPRLKPSSRFPRARFPGRRGGHRFGRTQTRADVLEVMKSTPQQGLCPCGAISAEPAGPSQVAEAMPLRDHDMVGSGVIALARPRQGHFDLGTGFHGDVWLDLDALFLRPSLLRPHVRWLADHLRGHRIDAVCGPMEGGAFLAQAIAGLLGTAFLPAHRAPAPPGQATAYRLPRVRGGIDGWRVAIADDAVNAGTAVQACSDRLRGDGAVPVAVAALLSLGPASATVAEAMSMPFYAADTVRSHAWPADECSLCARRVPLTDPSSLD